MTSDAFQQPIAFSSLELNIPDVFEAPEADEPLLFPETKDGTHPPIEFRVPLKLKRGKNQLRSIRIWHDFDWREKFRHNKPMFRGGKSLAAHLIGCNTNDKELHLILHCQSDIKDFRTENENEYIAVINIDQYLVLSANPDAALLYFARQSGSSINMVAEFRTLCETPEGKAALIHVIDDESVRGWVENNPQRLTDLITSLSHVDEIDLDQATLLRVLAKNKSEGLARLLSWVVTSGAHPVCEAIERLDVRDIGGLSSLAALATLRRLVERWKNSKHEPEEFWQSEFEANSFALSQLFAYPVVFIQGKPYVGNKRYDSLGAEFSDFLFKSELTSNTLLIEIKMPSTKLLRRGTYRNGVYAPTNELAGACMQVLHDRSTLMRRYHELHFESGGTLQSHDPQCIVIAGSDDNLKESEPSDSEKRWEASRQPILNAKLTEITRRESFELFRNSQRGLTIITFDELFRRMQQLIDLLEGRLPFDRSEDEKLDGPN